MPDPHSPDLGTPVYDSAVLASNLRSYLTGVEGRYGRGFALMAVATFADEIARLREQAGDDSVAHESLYTEIDNIADERGLGRADFRAFMDAVAGAAPVLKGLQSSFPHARLGITDEPVLAGDSVREAVASFSHRINNPSIIGQIEPSRTIIQQIVRTVTGQRPVVVGTIIDILSAPEPHNIERPRGQ